MLQCHLYFCLLISTAPSYVTEMTKAYKTPPLKLCFRFLVPYLSGLAPSIVDWTFPHQSLTKKKSIDIPIDQSDAGNSSTEFLSSHMNPICATLRKLTSPKDYLQRIPSIFVMTQSSVPLGFTPRTSVDFFVQESSLGCF